MRYSDCWKFPVPPLRFAIKIRKDHALSLAKTLSAILLLGEVQLEHPADPRQDFMRLRL